MLNNLNLALYGVPEVRSGKYRPDISDLNDYKEHVDSHYNKMSDEQFKEHLEKAGFEILEDEAGK